ncbi:glycosyltransferase [Pseudomonas tohonis]|uniref:glycosyltransferase n=1 Tax=Pseudomonas tohonis TaxID=2725477 RepID=UPI0022F00FF5|nr:glycosyltransferase [Pseudomonas tohonis]
MNSSLVDELVISDDGSTDSTLSLLAGIADPRVRVLEGPREGLIRNFEFLLTQARGDFIFLSDQDDVWYEGKVNTMLRSLQSCSLVVSDCHIVDADRNIIFNSFFFKRNSRPGLFNNLLRNSFLGCCMAFDRNVLNLALPFPHGVPMHDWWIGLVATAVGKVEFIHQPLMAYRRHGKNASATTEQSTYSLLQQSRWRLCLLFSLAVRLSRVVLGR